METNESLIESFITRLEEYGKTTIELLKLKSIQQAGNVVSKLFSHVLITIVFGFFLIFISIGAAFCIGNCIGETGYGFLIIAGFYLFLGILFWLLQPWIKARVKNSVISNLLN